MHFRTASAAGTNIVASRPGSGNHLPSFAASSCCGCDTGTVTNAPALTAAGQRRRCRAHRRVAGNSRLRLTPLSEARVTAESLRCSWSRPAHRLIYDGVAADPFHPIEGGSANAYDYVNGEPLRGRDLRGTQACPEGACNWATRPSLPTWAIICHQPSVYAGRDKSWRWSCNEKHQSLGDMFESFVNGSHTINFCQIACAAFTFRLKLELPHATVGCCGSKGPSYSFTKTPPSRGCSQSGGVCLDFCVGYTDRDDTYGLNNGFGWWFGWFWTF